MPYKSTKQRRWAHTTTGTKALGAKKVAEYDDASRGKKLPAQAMAGNLPPFARKGR